ncbi:MAG TPA: hypothetical protein VMV97_13005 [Sulfuriferula sp.]|nr:hypothetical protein [Sulfuriferula sp.]
MSKLPINLSDLLRQRTVEGKHIEYKSRLNLDAIVRILSTLATGKLALYPKRVLTYPKWV